jgi:hypothetical protein
MNVKTLLLLSITAGFPVAMLGCASASNATDSTFSYIRGDQRATLGATPPKIVAATVAAANELSLPVDTQSADGLVGKVLMHSSDGTKVEVNIKGEVNDQSEVTVRVGTFGDKTLQQRVLEKIKSHLIAAVSTSPAVSTAVTSTKSPAPAPAEVATPAAAPAVVPPSTPAPSAVPATVPTPSPTPDLAAPPTTTKPDQTPEAVNPLAPATAPATMPNGF